MGQCVWVKNEVTPPGISRKLWAKWIRPYRVVEKLGGGVAYRLQNPFTGVETQRAADEVRPYRGSEEWLLDPQEIDIEQTEQEVLPPRARRPPRRLIEEI